MSTEPRLGQPPGDKGGQASHQEQRNRAPFRAKGKTFALSNNRLLERRQRRCHRRRRAQQQQRRDQDGNQQMQVRLEPPGNEPPVKPDAHRHLGTGQHRDGAARHALLGRHPDPLGARVRARAIPVLAAIAHGPLPRVGPYPSMSCIPLIVISPQLRDRRQPAPLGDEGGAGLGRRAGRVQVDPLIEARTTSVPTPTFRTRWAEKRIYHRGTEAQRTRKNHHEDTKEQRGITSAKRANK